MRWGSMNIKDYRPVSKRWCMADEFAPGGNWSQRKILFHEHIKNRCYFCCEFYDEENYPLYRWIKGHKNPRIHRQKSFNALEVMTKIAEDCGNEKVLAQDAGTHW
jgi:hypothetical protein